MLCASRPRRLADAAGPRGGGGGDGRPGHRGPALLTRAYAQAPAAQVGPFIYTSVVFAGVLDWLVWGRLPDALSVAGGVLVSGAGILALRLGPAPADP